MRQDGLLEPRPRRWTFRFGDALPADDPVARFVVSVGAALNDLVLVHRLYVPDEVWGLLRRDPTPAEDVYFIRLIASAAFEFLRLFDKGRQHPRVNALLHHLGPHGDDCLATINRLGALRPRLKHIRDSTAHYPWPTSAHLREALAALADQQGALEADMASMASIRADFSDQVLVQWLAEDSETFKELATLLLELVIAAIRLGQIIIDQYLGALPEDVVQRHPPEGHLEV